MEVGGEAVGAMQAYLRLKRYILPSGIAREALQAALPFLPSAARELALEERLQAIEQQLVVNLGYFHDEKRILLETLQSHIISHIAAIRVLSSPDHADAGKVEGDGWLPKAAELYDKCKLFPETSAEGFMALLQLRNHVAEILPSAPSQEVAG